MYNFQLNFHSGFICSPLFSQDARLLFRYESHTCFSKYQQELHLILFYKYPGHLWGLSITWRSQIVKANELGTQTLCCWASSAFLLRNQWHERQHGNKYMRSCSAPWGLQGEKNNLEFHIWLKMVMGFMISAPFQQCT